MVLVGVEFISKLMGAAIAPIHSLINSHTPFTSVRCYGRLISVSNAGVQLTQGMDGAARSATKLTKYPPRQILKPAPRRDETVGGLCFMCDRNW